MWYAFSRVFFLRPSFTGGAAGREAALFLAREGGREGFLDGTGCEVCLFFWDVFSEAFWRAVLGGVLLFFVPGGKGRGEGIFLDGTGCLISAFVGCFFATFLEGGAGRGAALFLPRGKLFWTVPTLRCAFFFGRIFFRPFWIAVLGGVLLFFPSGVASLRGPDSRGRGTETPQVARTYDGTR